MTYSQPGRAKRGAFTLVELVVVIGIMVTLLALGAAFVPGLQGNQKVQNGVDRLAQWLLIAKQRAKHDGLPTGLRFVIDPSNPTQVSQFMYVQQPDPMSGDPAVGNSCVMSPTNPNQLQFSRGVDFIGADASNPLVTVGDYFEPFGGTPYSIAGATANTLTLNQQIAIVTPTTDWRILRQPRRVVGEDVLTLPRDVVVDLTTIPGTNTTWSQNVPSRGAVPNTTIPIYEILFSPSGAVIGQAASAGKILLWVRDATVPSPSQADSPTIQGNPSLVSIQVRTGFIGSYPVVPNTASASYPSQFYTAALQGRSGF
jgi:type II secretory pathway pseudopilin PulG